jgi:hypothetical protein
MKPRYLNAHIDYHLRNSGGPFVQHVSRLPGYPPGVYKEIRGKWNNKPRYCQLHRSVYAVKTRQAIPVRFNLKIKASTMAPTTVFHRVPAASISS